MSLILRLFPFTVLKVKIYVLFHFDKITQTYEINPSLILLSFAMVWVMQKNNFDCLIFLIFCLLF